MAPDDLAGRKSRTKGREATEGVIPGRFALSVGSPDLPAPDGWRWTALSEVAQLESGHTPSRRHPDYWDGGVPWIGIRDAVDNHGRWIDDTQQHISELGLENSSARLLPARTVCLSRTASVGYVVVMRRTMATSQDFVNWVCGPKLEPDYLKYVLLAERDSLLRFASGTTHQTIYYPEAKAFHVLLPPIGEQRRIAHILGSLDDKIELNRRMNETLEAMGRALFKSWFVDFDPVRAKAEGRQPVGMDAEIAKLFPSEFVGSELGEIPKGWSVGPYGDGVRVTKGRSYKSDDLQPSSVALVTLKSFHRGGGYRMDGLKSYVGDYKPEQVVAVGDLVVAFTDVTQAAEVIGRPALVEQARRFTTLVASLDVGIVRSFDARLPIEYLYHSFLDSSFRDHTYANSNGSTVLHLAAGAVERFVGLWPSLAVAEAFRRIISPLLTRARLNTSESAALRDLRDALLPALLSGRIDAMHTA
jgi:type I restriction enzyme S subunit